MKNLFLAVVVGLVFCCTGCDKKDKKEIKEEINKAPTVQEIKKQIEKTKKQRAERLAQEKKEADLKENGADFGEEMDKDSENLNKLFSKSLKSKKI